MSAQQISGKNSESKYKLGIIFSHKKKKKKLSFRMDFKWKMFAFMYKINTHTTYVNGVRSWVVILTDVL